MRKIRKIRNDDRNDDVVTLWAILEPSASLCPYHIGIVDRTGQELWAGKINLLPNELKNRAIVEIKKGTIVVEC